MTMTMSATANRPSIGWRLFHKIPVIGWIAKDMSRDINMVFYGLLITATALVLAVMTWGLVVLTLAALCLVPLMFVFFVCISWPFPAAE
jgi:hypothetical protein